MADKWDYSELSKAAKAAGGPERFVELIEEAGREAGRREMLPWIAAAAVGASLLTLASIKIADFLKAKRKEAHDEYLLAREELIKGIRKYDSAHDKEGGDENADVFVL